MTRESYPFNGYVLNSYSCCATTCPIERSQVLILLDHYDTLDTEVVGVEFDPYARFGRKVTFDFALGWKWYKELIVSLYVNLVALFKADAELAKVVLGAAVIECKVLLIAPQVLLIGPWQYPIDCVVRLVQCPIAQVPQQPVLFVTSHFFWHVKLALVHGYGSIRLAWQVLEFVAANEQGGLFRELEQNLQIVEIADIL